LSTIANFNNTQTNCGTYAGYSKHSKLKEKPCQPCRDARNAYRSKYYKAHPEKKRAMDIKYVSTHRQQVAKHSAKYRENNLEKSRAASLKWNKANPEKMNSAARKRRAVRLQNGWEPYTKAQVLELYGTECYLCSNPINPQAPRRIGKEKGWELGLHIDHVIPIVSGGSDTLKNVRPTHAICNMQKGNKMLDDFEVEIDPSLFEDEDVELEDLDLEDLEELYDEEEE
jgi:5-methylcytosine-specific restriction endonuclease McrA